MTLEKYKVLELSHYGTYIVDVLETNKNISKVVILGVLRYPAQGLSKDKYDVITFINQKPLEFQDIKTVPNQYLKDTDIKNFEGYKVGTKEFYIETLRSSLIMAQYTIFNDIKRVEAKKQPANWNHCQVVNLLTEHAKDFGFKLVKV